MKAQTKITTDKHTYTFAPSTYANRPYRLSAIKKNSQLPAAWKDGRGWCWHWQYIFIYTDTNELFGFEYDYEDRFVGKVKINK